MKKMTNRHPIAAVLLLFCVITAVLPLSISAQPFPDTGRYDFYIFSEHAGVNKFTSSVENNILTIVSKTSMEFEQFTLALDSKTEVDLTTQIPLSFSYAGTKDEGMKIEGSVHVHGDTIRGIISQDGNSYPSKKLTNMLHTIFFESYVAEHEILLARKFLASGEDFKEIWFFYPSDFMLTGSMMSYESDIELETSTGSVLCTKISVSLQGGTPFFSYIDKKTNIPIYMDFPGVNTEIFHHDYYGDEANPKYTRVKK